MLYKKRGSFVLWIILVLVLLIVLGFFTNWFGISGKITWWGDGSMDNNLNLVSDDLQSRMTQLEGEVKLLKIDINTINSAVGNPLGAKFCCRGKNRAVGSPQSDAENKDCTGYGPNKIACELDSVCEWTTDCS